MKKQEFKRMNLVDREDTANNEQSQSLNPSSSGYESTFLLPHCALASYYLYWIIGLPWSFRWHSIHLQCRRPGFDPGLGRYPGKGKGYSLQYSGLENSMSCIVHGVTKSQTWLSDFHFPLISFRLGPKIFTKSYKHLKNLLCLHLCPKTPGSFHSSHTGLHVIFGRC